jgi:conjugative transposon TraN protein
MKTHILFLLFATLLIAFTAFGQTSFVNATEELQPVTVTYNKTTSIIFPASITSVDRGSKDVLIQKAKGVLNVLQIKAAHRSMSETNLTVITADGKLNHFFLRYEDNPTCLTWKVSDDLHGNNLPVMLQEPDHQHEISSQTQSILKSKNPRFMRATRKHKMKLQLNDIFIHNEVLFFKLSITNRSNINYTTDMIRFYTEDKKQVKRTASQQLDRKPIFIQGDASQIIGKTTTTLVYAFEKFTIPEAKQSVIQLFEQQGGRHLQLKFQNRRLVRARQLPNR